tara:strand:+ start:321 stop:2954 length:2634 start_codon:yes stop_codon:yes gene_type:complete
MPKTRLISPGSIPNHKLLKNLQLQDNYLSNDGGNEGVSIDDNGAVKVTSVAPSLSFNGSDEYLDAGSFEIWGADSISFTFCAWVKFSEDVSVYFLSRRDDDGSPRLEWGYDASANRAVLVLVDSDGNAINATSGTNPTDGNWHHLAVVVARSSTDTVTFYKDGSVDGSGSNLDISTVDATLASTDNNTRIAAGGDSTPTNHFEGEMMEMGVWNAALDSDAISAIYNSGKSLDLSIDSGNYDNSSRLSAYWKMNEGTGTSIKDFSANSNTATAQNMDNTNWVYTKSAEDGLLVNGTEIAVYQDISLNGKRLYLNDAGSDSYLSTNLTNATLAIEGALACSTGTSLSFLGGNVNLPVLFVATTKTVSSTFDATAYFQETLNLASGAGGSDTHFGLFYQQIQTDLTGWDSVYLMYISGGDAARTFAVRADGKVGIGVTDPASPLEIFNTASQLKISYDASNYADISVASDGHLELATTGTDADLTLDSGAAINIEPASGSAILLDGTVSIDAGVITGATSITSTAFVGALTGNASGTAATVTGAAQTNITSLGTLTALTVDDVAINGKIVQITGDTDDTFSITTGAAGATTLATVDTAAAAGHLTLDADGILKLDAGAVDGTEGIQFLLAGNKAGEINTHHSATHLELYENGGASQSDYVRIKVEEHGATTIETVDDAAAAAHLTLDPDGDLIVSGADVKIDAAKKLYLDGGGNSYIHEAIADAVVVTVGGDTLLQMNEGGADGNTVYFKTACAGFTTISETFSDDSIIGSGGTHDTHIDFRHSNKIYMDVTDDITTMNLIFPVVSGNFLLSLRYDGDHDITNWKVYEADASAADGEDDVFWPGGTVPATTNSGRDVFSFFWNATHEVCYGVASLAFAVP